MKLTITDPPQWADNPKVETAWETPGYWRFALVGRTDIISAQNINGDLYLAPDRSAAHKALLSALTE